MKVVIPGGSGQVGAMLARAFERNGDEVVVLSRGASADPVDAGAPAGRTRTVRWDAATLGPWARELDGAEVVINLAGKNVNCRYNDANRQEILESRVASTRVVGEAIAAARRPPRVWLQASTATIYAHSHEAANDELTGRIGGGEPGAPEGWDFSIEVATAWERAAREARLPETRQVLLRSAIILSPDPGGIFATLLALVRRGLGGRAGDGRQYVSWIHEHDFVQAVRFLIASDLEGPVNLAAPEPLPQAEFMRVLREVWGMPVGLPATRWMLELGALFMRTETELILKSRRVVPTLLARAGFEFRYPTWPEAARELCDRWRG